MKRIDYEQLAAVLDQVNVAARAAECHGTLTGLLCGSGSYSAEVWLNDAMGDGAGQVHLCQDALNDLRQQTAQSLNDIGCSFEPLLPDDDYDLRARGTALAQWTEGFLYGLAMGGLPEELPKRVQEVMRDFTEFTHLDLTQAEGEDDEQAYTELLEYLRVGAQLVYVELTSSSQATPAVLH